MPLEPTTPEKLGAILTRGLCLVTVNLNEESDIPALTTVVTETSIGNPVWKIDQARISWCGGSQATVNCSELVGSLYNQTPVHR